MITTTLGPVVRRAPEGFTLDLSDVQDMLDFVAGLGDMTVSVADRYGESSPEAAAYGQHMFRVADCLVYRN